MPLVHTSIWSSHREVDENRPLLGYYAASGGNTLPTFRENRSALKWGLIGYHEMSVRDYHYLLRDSPEQRGSEGAHLSLISVGEIFNYSWDL
jgi:hypothetical protein